MREALTIFIRTQHDPAQTLNAALYMRFPTQPRNLMENKSMLNVQG